MVTNKSQQLTKYVFLKMIFKLNKLVGYNIENFKFELKFALRATTTSATNILWIYNYFLSLFHM